MASVYYLFDDALNLSEDIVRGYQNRGQVLVVENTAATKIQRVFRGYLTRKEISKWNEAATIIQKVARGWLVRFHFPDFVHQKYDQMCEKKYYEAASIIQAHWKGILVRKEVCIKDILEQRAEAERENERLRKMISRGGASDDDENEDETEEERQEKLERQKERLRQQYKPCMKRIANMLIDRHHLLSTRSIKGVFSKKESEELFEIEKLLSCVPWKNYMKKVREIYENYSKGSGDAEEIKYNDKRLQKERNLLKQRDKRNDARDTYEIYDDIHKKSFSLNKKVDKKKYERLLNSMDDYRVAQTQIVRTEDKSKNISKTDFHLNVFFKELAKDCNIPPYYIDFWFKNCTAHNLDDP